MLRTYGAHLAFAISAFGVVNSFAQTAADQPSRSEQYQEQAIRLEMAPIKTRQDLIRYLKDADASNPLNKLSEDAKTRWLDTLTVNAKGEISSYWIDDIRSELSPTDAYKVFALFGTPELAPRVNNGQVETPVDAKIKAMKDKGVHPAITGYYCSGGYCTESNQLTCVENRCTPPPSPGH